MIHITLIYNKNGFSSSHIPSRAFANAEVCFKFINGILYCVVFYTAVKISQKIPTYLIKFVFQKCLNVIQQQ